MNDTTSKTVQDVSPDDKNLAMLAHLLGILFGFIPALIFWLMNKYKPEKAFVNDQPKEALNFQITIAIAYFVSCVLILVVIGLFLLAALWVINLVFCIIAGIAASNGTEYRYPIALRLLK